MLERLNALNELRQYGIGEASAVLGVNPQTLRDWEKADRIPRARRNGFRQARVYSACEIEQIGQYIRENYYTR